MCLDRIDRAALKTEHEKPPRQIDLPRVIFCMRRQLTRPDGDVLFVAAFLLGKYLHKPEITHLRVVNPHGSEGIDILR